MKAKIIDISNWEVLPQYSTEGTRDKRIVQSPDGFTYYLKRPSRRRPPMVKFENIVMSFGLKL